VDQALVRQFIETTLALSAPLLLAALGEVIGQKSGVLNIGLEGMMLCGAWAGAAASFWAHNAGLGLVGAAGAGVLMAALFALLTITFRADPVVVGTGLNLFALGLTGTLQRALAGHFPSMKSQTLPEWFFIGLGAELVPVLWWFLRSTRAGLKLRASGEQPAAAEASGTNVALVRWMATLFNGALCGVAGAFLTMSSVDAFGENVTAGRGFIALAIVIFGRWSPFGALAAALLFGAADAAQITLQGRIPTAYYPLLLALPYALTLLTLAGFTGKSKAPAALGTHL
jgi:simple sugar transport system permease protein